MYVNLILLKNIYPVFIFPCQMHRTISVQGFYYSMLGDLLGTCPVNEYVAQGNGFIELVLHIKRSFLYKVIFSLF